ncbi:hypothetical protein KVF89_19960 [Nocardioides carbamazepini]|uniref:hypothetical protein n=1 Tax=Nocardioides carbamazepini TaxID=2854259 RepID=UPI00214A8B11|nr:hypothetical protein [Nocardioides carbamazepini]MCR1784828.1 hypothetical protein [Nocardioides carbamazepini]
MNHTVSLAVPRRWSTRDAPAPGVVLLARAPAATPAGFTPELVVRTGPVDSALSLADWRADAMVALAGQLVDLEVEDADAFELDGEPVAYHRFSHRLGGVDVLCDQWAWLRDGVGVTLTGTVARADYGDYYDLFEDVAATVELIPRAAA